MDIMRSVLFAILMLSSVWNLLRWVSNRTIKETFVTPTDYRYPFLEK